MKYQFAFSNEAKLEFQKAQEYYLTTAGELVNAKFVSAVETTQNILERHPGLIKLHNQCEKVYKYSIPKFPYTFYLRKDDTEFTILALAFRHQSRNPEQLNQLIKARIQALTNS
jgi:plasmid stabilization system protein ParE